MRTFVSRDRALCYAVRLLPLIMLTTARADAANIQEGGSKLARGYEIIRTYVTPLGLKGKSAANALNVLVSEGFRCDLKPRRMIGDEDSPLSDCLKQPSGFGPLCDDLIVSAYFEKQEKTLSPAELLGRLERINVRGGFAFCPYRNPPKAEYITYQNIGADTLAMLVRSLDLVGNAQSTFDKLMLDGYYCGFELDPTTRKPVAYPKMICNQSPTNIKYCYEAKLVMDVRWSASAMEALGLLNGLKAAQILRVQSSCEVPAAEQATKGSGLSL